MAKHNTNTLVDQKLAVSLFLDSLLRDTEAQPEVVTETPEAKVDVVAPVEEIQPETEARVQIDTETVIEPEVKVEVESLPENDVTSGAPAWANEPFQILLFKVAGLKLAVPLVELSGVIEWTDSVTEMPGHAEFYMGILRHLDHKIPVIDTARMVLPINKLTELAGDEPRERVNHIVLIDDYAWGLACDEIGEVITLNPDDVRWRTANTSRDWLAGTVIEHMCALINGAGFSKMLEKGRPD